MTEITPQSIKEAYKQAKNFDQFEFYENHAPVIRRQFDKGLITEEERERRLSEFASYSRKKAESAKELIEFIENGMVID